METHYIEHDCVIIALGVNIKIMLNGIHNRITLKNKIFLVIIFITVIVLVVSIISVSILFSNYNRLLYQQIASKLQMKVYVIENELKEIEELSFRVFSDNQLQTYLGEIKDRGLDDTREYNIYKIRSNIEDLLNQFIYAKSYIEEIIVVDIFGNYIITKKKGTNIIDYGSIEYLHKLASPEGSNQWWEANPSSVYSVRSIRRIEKMAFDNLGVILIKVDMDHLMEYISPDRNAESIFIFNSERQQVLGLTEQYQRLTDYQYDDNSGYQIFKADSRRFFMSYLKGKYMNWVYVECIDFSQMQKNILSILNTLIVFLIVTLAGIMTGSSLMSRAIVQPLSNLIRKMSHVEYANLSQLITEQEFQAGDDEIGLLYRDFYIMLNKIDELIKKEYEMQLHVERTKYMALQSQINPHFLYNTLDTMNWVAKQNGQKVLSEMIEALGGLFRYIMNIDNQIIPLAQELDIVKYYILIQKYRFGDQLNFSVDVAEEHMKLKLPKMTLQPIVENAVKHCVEKMLKPCYISIRSKDIDSASVIIIKDNGMGLSQEKIDAVLKGEWKTQKRIGLHNINQRLIYTFGSGYGIQINSNPGRGTSIIIRVPGKFGGKDYSHNETLDC